MYVCTCVRVHATVHVFVYTKVKQFPTVNSTTMRERSSLYETTEHIAEKYFVNETKEVQTTLEAPRLQKDDVRSLVGQVI